MKSFYVMLVFVLVVKVCTHPVDNLHEDYLQHSESDSDHGAKQDLLSIYLGKMQQIEESKYRAPRGIYQNLRHQYKKLMKKAENFGDSLLDIPGTKMEFRSDYNDEDYEYNPNSFKKDGPQKNTIRKMELVTNAVPKSSVTFAAPLQPDQSQKPVEEAKTMKYVEAITPTSTTHSSSGSLPVGVFTTTTVKTEEKPVSADSVNISETSVTTDSTDILMISQEQNVTDYKDYEEGDPLDPLPFTPSSPNLISSTQSTSSYNSSSNPYSTPEEQHVSDQSSHPPTPIQENEESNATVLEINNNPINSITNTVQEPETTSTQEPTTSTATTESKEPEYTSTQIAPSVATEGRVKRQAEETEYATENDPGATEAIVSQQGPTGWNQCVSKTDLEAHKLIEKQHLQDLKTELQKLQELIKILREQQGVLNSLNEIDLKYYQAYVNNSFARNEIQEEKRLIELLEEVNAKLSNSTAVSIQDRSLHGEVPPAAESIKNIAEGNKEVLELRNEVEKLKSTIDKLIRAKKPMSEQEIQDELERHQHDIANIKQFLRNLINNSTRLQDLHNSTLLRSSEYNQYSDPKFIQLQITNIQRQINQLMAKTKRADHRLRGSDEPEEEEDDTTEGTTETASIEKKIEAEDKQLAMLTSEAQRVKQSLQTFNFLLNQADPNITDIIVRELERQQRQMVQIQHIIEDMIKIKQEQLLFQRLNQTKTDNDTDTKDPVVGQNNDSSWSNNRARSSDSEDLRKLLKIIAKEGASSDEDETLDDSGELETKIKTLEKQLKSVTKKKKKIELETQIKTLQKQIKRMEKAKEITDVESKTTDEDGTKSIVRILQKMLKEFDKPQSKDVDDDKEMELQKLQEAINKLRPKDQSSLDNEPKAESAAQFEFLLNKLIAEQNNLTPPLPSQNRPQTGQQQLDLLIRRLMAMQKQNQPLTDAALYPYPNYLAPATIYSSANFPYAIQSFTAPNQYLNPQISNSNDVEALDANKKQFFRGFEKAIPENYNSGVSNYEANSQQLDTHTDPNSDFIAQDRQRINSLTTEIYQLQNAIDNLNSPNYVKKPEDQETIYKLDKQINDLKQVINNLNQKPERGPYYTSKAAHAISQKIEQAQGRGSSKARYARSSDDLEANETANELLGKFASLFEDTGIENAGGDGNAIRVGQERKASSEDINSIRHRLSDLQKELDLSIKARHGPAHRESTYSPVPQQSYSYEVQEYSPKPPDKLHTHLKQKKLDIFEKVITKIIDIVVDKTVIAIPILLRKIISVSFDDLTSYGSGYGYDSYALQGLKKLGIFGFIPLVLLKLVNGLSYFVSVLKQNAFFKNFLLPALVLLGINGLVVLLIWFMQPNIMNYNAIDYDKKYDYGSYNKPYPYKAPGYEESHNYHKDYRENETGYDGYNNSPMRKL